MAARGQREPAGIRSDDGQRPELQRHRLSAGRHREPRPDPGHHRHQPEPRRDRRVEDHLAELRRRVRPGDGRRRLDPDQVGHQRLARERVRVLAGRQVPGAQSLLAGAAQPPDRPVHPGDEQAPVRGHLRRAHHREPHLLLRGLPGASPDPGRLAPADRPDGGRPRGRSERLRRGHLRSRQRPAAREPHAVFRQRHSGGPALAPGTGPAAADPAAQRAGRGKRDPRELHRQRQRDLRRRSVRRAPGSPDRRRLEPVRPLHGCQLPARRADGLRAGRRSVVCQPGRRVRRGQQEPRHRLRPVAVVHAAGRLPVRVVPLQRRRAALRLRHAPCAGGGDSRPEPGRHVHQRPALSERRRHRRLQGRIGPRREQLQLPARPGRAAVADGRQRHQDLEQPHVQVRRRRPARLQPARAERFPPLRSAELQHRPDPRGRRRRARPGQFPAGRRHLLLALCKLQHRRAGAAVAPLLLRAGHVATEPEADDQLRAAPGRHQPADRERARQRRVARPGDGPDQRRRCRRRGPVGQHREPPQLGAAGGGDLPDRREDGDPRRLRPHLRHRRLRVALRPQRHAEPAGAGIAGVAWGRELRRGLQPRSRADRPGLSEHPRQRPVPAAKRDLLQGLAPQAAAAVGGRVQRHAAAPAHRLDVG